MKDFIRMGSKKFLVLDSKKKRKRSVREEKERHSCYRKAPNKCPHHSWEQVEREYRGRMISDGVICHECQTRIKADDILKMAKFNVIKVRIIVQKRYPRLAKNFIIRAAMLIKKRPGLPFRKIKKLFKRWKKARGKGTSKGFVKRINRILEQ